MNAKQYGDLANAIILQAVVDYELSLAILSTKYEPKTDKEKEKIISKKSNAKRTKGECEAFFKSGWFSALSKVEPDAIRVNIYEGVKNAKKARFDEKKKCYYCDCGKRLKIDKGRFEKPVTKCIVCKKYYRIYGEPIEIE